MAVELMQAKFDAWNALRDYELSRLTAGKFGACAAFTGTMRDFNQGDNVTAMTLEHYPGMTEKQLERIIEDALKRWSLQDALIMHRVGDILPGEAIVLTACWSAHREAAFAGCRFLMEALKNTAPFWKKETLADESTRWVDKNTPGTSG